MPNFIRNLHDKTENLKGKELIVVLSLAIIFPLIVGILLQNFTSGLLNDTEIGKEEIDVVEVVDTKARYEGKVVYVDPKLYPNDNISYSLVDKQGDELILLMESRLDEAKLTVVEGLDVIIFGDVVKSNTKKVDVLRVDKIVITNN